MDLNGDDDDSYLYQDNGFGLRDQTTGSFGDLPLFQTTLASTSLNSFFGFKDLI